MTCPPRSLLDFSGMTERCSALPILPRHVGSNKYKGISHAALETLLNCFIDFDIMVWDIIRDSTFGQLVRLATGNKYFQYPEERPHFEFSRSYGDARHPVHPIDISLLGGSEITQRELAGRVFEGGVTLETASSTDQWLIC